MKHTRTSPSLPRTRVFLNVVTLLGFSVVFPFQAESQVKPCKGFVGAHMTRRELLRSCGEPLEIIEEEPQRITLWRYPGHPFVAVRSDYQIASHQTPTTIADVWKHVLNDQAYSALQKQRTAPSPAKAEERNFRQIIDEAAELPDSKNPSSGGRPPGAQPPELASPPDGN